MTALELLLAGLLIHKEESNCLARFQGYFEGFKGAERVIFCRNIVDKDNFVVFVDFNLIHDDNFRYFLHWLVTVSITAIFCAVNKEVNPRRLNSTGVHFFNSYRLPTLDSGVVFKKQDGGTCETDKHHGNHDAGKECSSVRDKNHENKHGDKGNSGETACILCEETKCLLHGQNLSFGAWLP